MKGLLMPVLWLSCMVALQATTIKITDFGGKGDNATDNGPAFVAAFQAMRENPGTTLVLPPGRYRINSQEVQFVHERHHLRATGLKNCTITGEGAELIFTNPDHGAMLFYDCPKLKLHGFTVDYDPVAFTQGPITWVDPANPRCFDMEIEEGFPEANNVNFKNVAKEGKFMIGYVFDAKTRKLFTDRLYDNHKSVDTVERLAQGKYRITLKKHSRPDAIAVGRLFLLQSRNPSNGLTLHACPDVELSHLTIYNTSHQGVNLRWATARPYIHDCKIMIRPNTRRLISLNADALYVDGCSEPRIENNYFDGVMDDVIVLPVHGRYVHSRLSDRSFRVRCTWSVPFMGNNTLEAIEPKTGRRSGALPVITKMEKPKYEEVDGAMLYYEVVHFHKPVENVKPGDVLFNLSFSNQKFVIRNNVIKDCRAKGLKLHGMGGVASNNSVDGTTFTGIEAGWQYSGGGWYFMWADNMVIENNTINRAAMYGLIQPTNPGYATGVRLHIGPDNMSVPCNKNIIVRNNRIDNSGQSALRAWHTEGLKVYGNRIGNFNLMEFPSDTMAFDTINCPGAEIRDNIIEGKSKLSAPAAPVSDLQQVLDMSVLEKAPAVKPATEKFDFAVPENIKPVYYRGLDFRGRPSWAFAWVGVPKNASPNAKVPGIVLVHGGGGTAFLKWTRHWVDRGYAVVAMDTVGCRPVTEFEGQNCRKEHGEGINNFPSYVGDVKNPRDAWTTQAVATVILGHSLLRSLPEVDANRTAITGISWGGYLTCIAAAIDKRFAAAAPVYGCGFLKDSRWTVRQATPEWLEIFDPAKYLGRVRMPILFVNTPNDQAYQWDSWCRSSKLPINAYRTSPGTFGHSHLRGIRPEVEHFVDDILQGRDYPRLSDYRQNGREIMAQVLNGKVSHARLLWTNDGDDTPDHKRKWESAPCKVEGGVVSAILPDGAKRYFLLGYSGSADRNAAAVK